ncbi:MAG: hypothetical protein ABSG64_05625 [Solirubrobacteraceae bacterium]|jgi:hypothetical protein
MSDSAQQDDNAAPRAGEPRPGQPSGASQPDERAQAQRARVRESLVRCPGGGVQAE